MNDVNVFSANEARKMLENEIKDMSQNGPYWFIEMKYGSIFGNVTCASITYDENEPVGYFSKNQIKNEYDE